MQINFDNLPVTKHGVQ